MSPKEGFLRCHQKRVFEDVAIIQATGTKGFAIEQGLAMTRLETLPPTGSRWDFLWAPVCAACHFCQPIRRTQCAFSTKGCTPLEPVFLPPLLNAAAAEPFLSVRNWGLPCTCYPAQRVSVSVVRTDRQGFKSHSNWNWSSRMIFLHLNQVLIYSGAPWSPTS